MWVKSRLLGVAMTGMAWSSHAQIDTTNVDIKKMITDNFTLYKKHIDYPHDTIHVQRKKDEKDVIATAKWYGQININTLANISDITSHVILHELTHTLKDTTSSPIQTPYRLKDGSQIISINGLTFDILLASGEITKFPLVEEAIAEYISYHITQTEEMTDPSYYALGYFIRQVSKHTNTTAQDRAKAIKNDDYLSILQKLNIAEDGERGDILFSIFQQIANLGKNQVSKKNIQSRVNRRSKTYLWR